MLITSRFYNSPILSDVTVCFGEHKINAHKIVLSFSSAFFNKAFTGPFAEASSTELRLHGDDDEAVIGMLKYFYGEIVLGAASERQFDLAIKYSIVADKYDVPGLLQVAAGHAGFALHCSLEGPKDGTFAALRTMCSDDVPTAMRKAAGDWFCLNNYKKLINEPEFWKFLMQHSEFSVEILRNEHQRQLQEEDEDEDEEDEDVDRDENGFEF